MFRYLSTDEALHLFESEDPKTLTGRIWAIEYLSREDVPLYSLPELACHLPLFTKYLERDRKHLIKTGLPQKCFHPCRWLYQQLARLYDVKATGSPWPQDEFMRKHKGMPKVPAYNWVRYVPDKGFLGMETLRSIHCAYDEASFLRGMILEDAKRLEACRPKLLDLKVAVLRELVEALDRADSSQLWRKCLKLLTDAILADEVDFFLRMDRFYIGVDVRQDGAAEASPKMIPGGLTNLLEVIGHCEKEITIGTLAVTRQALGDLVKPARAERFRTGQRHTGNAYYWFRGRPEQSQLDAALDQYLSLSEEETDFWSEYRQRVNKTMENEFYAEVTIRTRVKRHLVEKFEPHIRTYADWANVRLEDSGQVPPLVLSPLTHPAGGTGKKRRGGKGAVAEIRSWTQPDLDAAIRKYKAERSASYQDLINRIAEGAKGAKRAAQGMFGRNSVARMLGVKAPAMVPTRRAPGFFAAASAARSDFIRTATTMGSDGRYGAGSAGRPNRLNGILARAVRN